MKIFATSDIHGSRVVMNLLKNIPKSLPDVDVIAVCGDIGGKTGRDLKALNRTQMEDYEDLVKVFGSIYHEAGLDCAFVLGNDDWFEASDSGYLRRATVFGGENDRALLIPFELVKITPFSTNREANENKIEYELWKAVEGLSKEEIKNAVFIAHDVPFNACDEVLRRGEHVGSLAIRSFIEEFQPKAWFGGHIHESFGVDMIGETFVFNCACQSPYTLSGWVFDTKTCDFTKVKIDA